MHFVPKKYDIIIRIGPVSGNYVRLGSVSDSDNDAVSSQVGIRQKIPSLYSDSDQNFSFSDSDQISGVYFRGMLKNTPVYFCDLILAVAQNTEWKLSII